MALSLCFGRAPGRTLGTLALAASCCVSLLLPAGDAAAAAAQAAPPDLVFQRVGDIEQVPDGVVTSLAQTGDGLLWIGTTEGLVRHDGYRFRLFTHDPAQADSLPGNRIQQLLSDAQGRLWVGTYSNGVARFDAERERFLRFESRPGDPASLPEGTVRALAQTPDGAIWVGTTGNGLGRIDPDGSVRRYRAAADDPLSLPDDRISALGVDAEGSLWIGSWQGLSRLRAGSQQFQRVLSEPEDPDGFANTTIRGIHVTGNGDVWVGAQQGQMARLRAAVLKSEAVPQAHEVQRWRGGGLNAALEPGDGSLWIAHARGIDVYSADTAQRLRELRHRAVDPLSLANAEVRDLQGDGAGGIWIGTFGGGLQRANARANAVSARRFDPLLDAPLSQLSAQTLSPAGAGGLWVGVAQNGVARLDSELRLVEVLRSGDPAQGQLAGQQPSGLIEAADGSLWVATERGLFLRAPEGGGFSLVSGPGFLEGVSIRRLWSREDGSLWIATGDGLFRRDADGRLVRLAGRAGERIGGSINALIFDEVGAWVGGSAGLFRYDGAADSLRVQQLSIDGVIQQADVLGLLRDASGQIWIDAGGLQRVRRIEGDRIELEPVSARHGYQGIAFGANLLDDSEGRIWSHRFMYDPKADRLHRLGRADGALAGTGWFRAYLRLPDGRLVFGASEGLLVVTPERYQPWTFEPPLVFTELRVDGEPRPIGPRARELVLRPGERSLVLEFAALDYSAPELLRYRYRLGEGDWVELNAAARTASIGGLWPGHYQLEVQGSNRSGRFGSDRLRLDVEVQPLWWQTKAATALAVLGAIALLLALVQWRERRLRRAKARLEAEVEARTVDLRALSAELERKNRAFEEASLTDPLTGLRNRRFAMQEMPKEVALCLRRIEAAGQGAASGESDLVLFLIDFDHFKTVNDDFGHAAGDAVLCQFAERLRSIFRGSDHLIRWGGEEFLVVARDSHREAAAELAERLRRCMAEQPFVLDNGSAVRRTVCIGFAPFPLLRELPMAADWEEVVDLADRLLYACKRAGRNAWMGLFPERANALPRRGVDWCDPGMVRSGAARLLSNVPEGRALAALGEHLHKLETGV